MGVCPECETKLRDKTQKTLYRCDYCGREFCIQHRDPKFAVYSIYRIEKNLRVKEAIERDHAKEGGPPCLPYSKILIQEIEYEDKREYDALKALLESPMQTKNPKEDIEQEQLLHRANRKKNKNIKKGIKKGIKIIGFLLFLGITWFPNLLFAGFIADPQLSGNISPEKFGAALLSPFVIPFHTPTWLSFRLFGFDKMIIVQAIYYPVALFLTYKRIKSRAKLWHYALLLGIAFINLYYVIHFIQISQIL